MKEKSDRIIIKEPDGTSTEVVLSPQAENVRGLARLGRVDAAETDDLLVGRGKKMRRASMAGLKEWLEGVFAAKVHTHPWGQVTGKPSKFPPSAHTHQVSEVAGAAPVSVGEIIRSLRSDLGDKYLLCNGDTVLPEDYPELHKILPPGFDITSGQWTRTTDADDIVGGTSLEELNCFVYGNGYFVADAEYSVGTPKGPWTSIGLPTSGDSGFSSITFANGYWVATTAGHIYYSQNTPTGPWTEVSLDISGGAADNLSAATNGDGWRVSSRKEGSGNSYNVKITKVKYLNGYWIALCTGSVFFYRRATSPMGTWSVKVGPAWDSYGMPYPLEDIFYGNGYWVLRCGHMTKYSSNLTGDSWANTGLPNGAGSANYHSNLYWENGYWYALSVMSSNYEYKLRRTANAAPNGGWELVSGAPTFYGGYIQKIQDVYVILGYYSSGGDNHIKVHWAETLDGEWTVYEKYSSTADGGSNWAQAKSTICEGNGWLAFLVGTTKSSAGHAWYMNTEPVLPTISDADAYVYVRAKL